MVLGGTIHGSCMYGVPRRGLICTRCVCVEEEGGDKYSLCNNVLEEFGLNDSAYHYFLFCLKHIQSEKLDNRDSSLLLFLL